VNLSADIGINSHYWGNSMARAKGSTGQAKVISKQEFNRVLAVIKGEQGKHMYRNQVIVAISYYLGLRSSELANLKLLHLIDRSGSLRDHIRLSSHMTKGGKHRDVYLSHKGLRSILLEYISHQFGENPPVERHRMPFFSSQKGGRFSAKTIAQLIKQMYLAAGIEGATSHSGRRTMITNLATMGVDIKSIAKIAGHSNISTTALYIDANPTKLANILSRLD